MTTTSSQQHREQEAEDEQKRENNRQIARLVCLFVIAGAITMVARWYEGMPPEPNYAGYYDGDWVNKRGQLVSSDGKVLQDKYAAGSKAPTPNYVEYKGQ